MNSCEHIECRHTITVLLLICGLHCLLPLPSAAAPEAKKEESAEVKNPYAHDKEAIEAGHGDVAS